MATLRNIRHELIEIFRHSFEHLSIIEIDTFVGQIRDN